MANSEAGQEKNERQQGDYFTAQYPNFSRSKRPSFPRSGVGTPVPTLRAGKRSGFFALPHQSGVQKLSAAVFCIHQSGVQKLSTAVFCTSPSIRSAKIKRSGFLHSSIRSAKIKHSGFLHTVRTLIQGLKDFQDFCQTSLNC